MPQTIQQVLMEGIEEHQKGNLEQAEKCYRAILHDQPDHADANHNLGILAVSVNKTEMAVSLFKNALKQHPKIEQFWVSYIDTLIKQNKYNDAKKALKQAKANGLSKEKADTFEIELNQSKDIKYINPPQEEINTLLEHYETGRFKEAEKLALAMTQKYPHHQFGWKVLGVLLGSKEPARALECSKKAIQLAPSDPESYNNIAVVLKEVGRLNDSKELCEQAILLKSDYPDAHNNLGNALKELGDFENAKSSYLQAISFKPDYFEAYNNLANLMQQQGRYEEAEINFRKAIDLNSSDPVLYNNLGHILQELGNIDEAEINIRKAISFNKNYFEAYFDLGNNLKQQGRYKEAESNYKRAIELKPDYTDARNNLGVVLQELDKLDEAAKVFKELIKINPNYVDAHYNLANLMQQQGKYEEAESNYKRAIELKPDYLEAHNNLGNTLNTTQKFQAAENNYRRAIAIKPDYAEAYYNLGNALKNLCRYKEAESNYKRAIELKPDYSEAHNNLGGMILESDRLDEAEYHYTKAISLKPDFAEAHRNLSRIKKFNKSDEQFKQMQELYSDNNLSDEQRCNICFGLAKASEDIKDFEQAFNYYFKGNSLRKKLLGYDISFDVELFNQIKVNHPKISKKSIKLKTQLNTITPIFIVGMPRSGTTLVEQIISSHSQVTGAGELPFVAQLGYSIARGLSEANERNIFDFREKYIEKIQTLSDGTPFVTDKMPHNFRYIGLIAAAFPEAKIVHVIRNSSAVSWANYSQYFPNSSIGHCYDLNDIVQYHGLYEDLMMFWGKSLNNRVYNLDYEALTVNQEVETKKLIDNLDIGWEEKCLRPERNTRRVGTASNIQIRKKVYKGSSEKWKTYKPFLDGVFDNLNKNI